MVRTAGMRVALQMIRVVSCGDLLPVMLQVRVPVALGICGIVIAPVAASFLASWVAPGVSVIGGLVPDSGVVGFPMLVVSEPMERWCWFVGRGFFMQVVPLALVALRVAGFWSECVEFLLLLPGVGFPWWTPGSGVRLPIIPRFPESWPGVDSGPCWLLPGRTGHCLPEPAKWLDIFVARWPHWYTQ